MPPSSMSSMARRGLAVDGPASMAPLEWPSPMASSDGPAPQSRCENFHQSPYPSRHPSCPLPNPVGRRAASVMVWARRCDGPTLASTGGTRFLARPPGSTTQSRRSGMPSSSTPTRSVRSANDSTRPRTSSSGGQGRLPSRRPTKPANGMRSFALDESGRHPPFAMSLGDGDPTEADRRRRGPRASDDAVRPRCRSSVAGAFVEVPAPFSGKPGAGTLGQARGLGHGRHVPPPRACRWLQTLGRAPAPGAHPKVERSASWPAPRLL